MFDRPKYKSFARIQLKKRHFVPVMMTLAAFIIQLLLEVPYTKNVLDSAASSDLYASSDFFSAYRQFLSAYKQTSLETACSWLSFFILAIMAVAQYHVYLKMSRSPAPVRFSDFIDGFNEWWHAVTASLWMYMWILLWTLLFIIPGFIKMISYSQTYFIIAEFPELTARQALTISKKITKGYKWDLFVMDLSFAGWALLSALSCGIGFLWLCPYFHMSKTNAYHALMKHALETQILTADDLKQ